MDNQNTFFVEIENYIRNLISKNNGIFDRDSIMMQSKEWMQKFPVEFNSMLNLIENEGKNDEMMDDSAPSVAFGGSRFVDDSAPSVTFGGSYSSDYQKDQASSVNYSPKADSMSSDYSPCGNLDDDDCGPLQRTMSS